MHISNFSENDVSKSESFHYNDSMVVLVASRALLFPAISPPPLLSLSLSLFYLGPSRQASREHPFPLFSSASVAFDATRPRVSLFLVSPLSLPHPSSEALPPIPFRAPQRRLPKVFPPSNLLRTVEKKVLRKKGGEGEQKKLIRTSK